MKVKFVFIIGFIAMVFASCRKDNWVNGSGPLVQENRTLPQFSKLHCDISADVEFVKDSVYFAEITAQENVADVLRLNVNGDKLEIDFENFVRVYSYDRIKIKVHGKNLESIEISGSGKIFTSENLVSNNLSCEISGSGRIDIGNIVLNNNLNVEISGSGNFSSSGGTCNFADFDISGSGNIYTKNVLCKKIDATISGSGDLECASSELLTVRISGSGDVTYSGNPAVEVKISGSGKVKKF